MRCRGAGDHGIVLEAYDQQLERTVVVKVLLPHYVANTAAEARFRFEAQSAASLTHPNLDAVYDWGVEFVGGTKVPYLVLEHLSGGSLRDILDRGRLLSPSQALVVGLDVCRGLDYMHRRGVIHCELKPANLVFGEDRHVRILDVGLSRMVAEEIWRDPTEAGLDAARYASPEQAQGGSPAEGTLDAATDIYSLTLILIEAVTGQIPFVGDSTVATLNRVDKLMPVSADLGPLASVLERAGSAVPADRYTAAEFGRALVQAAERLPRPAPMPILANACSAPTPADRRPTDPTGPVASFGGADRRDAAPAAWFRPAAAEFAPDRPASLPDGRSWPPLAAVGSNGVAPRSLVDQRPVASGATHRSCAIRAAVRSEPTLDDIDPADEFPEAPPAPGRNRHWFIARAPGHGCRRRDHRSGTPPVPRCASSPTSRAWNWGSR